MKQQRGKDLDSLLGNGARVAVSPGVVTAGSTHTFRFRITLGGSGLAPGDALGLVCGSNHDRWQMQFASHAWGAYTPWQVHDPAASNFLEAAAGGSAVPLRVRVGASGGLKQYRNAADSLVRALAGRGRYVLEVSAETPLPAGTVITITWGERRYGGAGVRAPALAFCYYFLPFLFSRLPRWDRDLPVRSGDFDDLPAIRVTGGAATRLHCAPPPLAAVGERLDIPCAAVDEFGNRDEHFRGTARLVVSDPGAETPGTITFGARHRGARRVGGLRFHRPGWQSVRLVAGALESQSLPVLVGTGESRERVYFGDMHGHTLDDDGTCRGEEHYDYARHTAGLDFCSLAVHAEYFGSMRAWTGYLRAASRAHAPGRFVVFYGYEWAGQGHLNAYFLRESDAVNIYGKHILRGRHPVDEPPFRRPCNREKRFLELVGKLGVPAFCISHCHSGAAAPLNDRVLRLHEVYSMHQRNPLDRKLRAILARGARVGVVAGSDTHRLPQGSLCPDPDRLWHQPEYIAGHRGSQSIQKKCGLQAVFATARSRRALWGAMRHRRTYGTTGARIVLLFSINEESMGGEVRVAAGQRLRVNLRVGGTAALTEVRLFRHQGGRWSSPVCRRDIGEAFCDLETVLEAPRDEAIYYLRVTQADRERAWSSPIWVVSAAGVKPGADRRRAA